MGKLEKIQGEVDSIIYKSEDGGFCVLMLNCDNELVTVVGDMGDVEEGEELVLTGEFTTHRKFGEQFKVTIFERSLPTTSAAIQRYLASGAISGIGPVLARRLVNLFGDKTLEIIESDPDRLTEIEGITAKKAKKIQKEFKTTFAVRSLLVYLSQFEIPTSYSIRAWKRWGDTAEEIIRSNPYTLCSDGVDVPFVKADEIASKQKIPKDSVNRIKAGITCVLRQNADAGHTCLPLESLKNMTSEFLGVSQELFMQVLDEEIDDENLFYYYKQKRPYVMLREYYRAEEYIARRLEIMRSISYDNKIDFSEVIDLEEETNGIIYEKIQRQAINLALSKGFLVLTGGPGTGKTTTLNAIISLYQQQGLNVMIAAPTGRAAKRISDLTGYDAKTIHRLLEVQFSGDTLSFVHNENNLLDCDALVVDEMSMVDSCLFEALLRAISVTCKLILVGDSDQLPSVGAGNVLKDIIDSGVMSVVTLKEIFRQAQESDIVMNAHKIVNGNHIDLTRRDKDFFFFQRLDFTGIQQLVVELCRDRLPKAYGYSPIENIQVLSPTRKGPSGTMELNRRLQAELNPPAAGKSEVRTPGYIYRKGDKVMQTRNDYEILWKKQTDDEKTESGAGIFNGDIGIIIQVNKILKSVTIDFEGRIAVYTEQMLENLELAYAVTVHKSQGSEFDVVILTVFGGYDKLYYRNLLYTAVTRAKKMLIIVGSQNRVNFMIDNDRRTLRYTALKNMLMENAEGDDSGQQKIDI
ncbi:MAG: ATP-dependent RecD-like DNA helicase [Ruminococcus sp.]|nr:ATP-dependent RecD-like DNA helicase [Ruminococcus sp.]